MVTVNKSRIIILVIVGIFLLMMGFLLSSVAGVSKIKISDVFDVIQGTVVTKEQLIVKAVRFPRAFMAILAGVSLAIAGALMQGITNNSIASPQILGINAGASFVVVVAIVFFQFTSTFTLIYLAFIGAALAGVFVFIVAYDKNGIQTVKLGLAGVTVSMLFFALTQGILIQYDNKLSTILFWLSGSFVNATMSQCLTILPWCMAGIFISLLLARKLNLFALGNDVSKGLGVNVNVVRFLAGFAVIILAGSIVSVAGPIGFIGLIVPHLIRFTIGSNYVYVLPLSALFGANLLLYSDVLSRFISYPYESPVGIITALIGAPYFLFLVRREAAKK